MEHHARLLNRPDPVEVSMRRRLAYGPTEGTRCGRSSSHSRGAATRRQWWRLLDPDDRACEESKGLRFRSVGPAAWGIAPGWAHALALVATAIVVLRFVTTVRARVTTAELLVPLSLLVTLSWPFPPTRYVLPLLPFVLCYTARGLAALASLVSGRPRRRFAPAVLWGLVAVSALTNAAYVRALHGPPADRPRWNLIFEERLALIRWLTAHVPSGQVIATTDPAQVYLYSGFETVGYWQASGVVDEWQRLGVHVFADTSYAGGQHPRVGHRPVYQSPAFGMRVFDVGRPAGTR